MAATDKVFAGSIPEILRSVPGPADLRTLCARPCRPDRRRRAAACPGDRGRHRRRDPRDRVAASRTCTHRRDRPQPADARSRRDAAAPGSPGDVAAGRRAGAAVRGSVVRRRGLPVRRDVLSRQGPGLPRGAPRAEAGRPLLLQRVGPDRRQRIRRCRDRGAGRGVPAGPAALPGPHAARLSRRRPDPRGSWPRRAFPTFRSMPWSTAAGRPRRGIRRSPIARARRCATRSRRATPRASTRRPKAATDAVARRFGSGAVDGRIRAFVVTAVP